MKRVLCVALSLLALAQFRAGGTAAQESHPATARDLYTGYSGGGGGQQGRPGVKVSIKLMRGGRERWVSPGEKFYSGDRIKLSLDTNFTGYVAVINTGPTGKKTLLYPQADDAVFPADGATLPPAEDKWIVFDNTTGEERVTLIFSTTPLGLHAGRPDPPSGPEPAQQPESGSTGVLTNNQDAQSVLDELNTRSINRGRDRSASRDMITQTVGQDTYSVATQAALSEPIGFEFVLRHGRR